ncbi:MAG: hypothetical protein EOP60_15780, partial [Sphingomonadales bacterium]
METLALHSDLSGISPQVLTLREALADRGKAVTSFVSGGVEIEVSAGTDSLWALIRREGEGGLALRAAYLGGPLKCMMAKPETGEVARLKLSSAFGEHVVAFSAGGEALEHVRMKVRFTPKAPMLLPFMPRDLYPLDAKDDPLGARGVVEATQRRLNSGLIYFRIDEPSFGNVLYF